MLHQFFVTRKNRQTIHSSFRLQYERDQLSNTYIIESVSVFQTTFIFSHLRLLKTK